MREELVGIHQKTGNEYNFRTMDRAVWFILKKYQGKTPQQLVTMAVHTTQEIEEAVANGTVTHSFKFEWRDPKEYSPKEVFNLIGEEWLTLHQMPEKRDATQKMKVGNYTVYKPSLRYMTFYQKGLCCSECGREGTYFILNARPDAVKVNGRYFSLYSDDGMEMSIEAIVPLSEGGENTVDNMKVVCGRCRQIKR